MLGFGGLGLVFSGLVLSLAIGFWWPALLYLWWFVGFDGG